MSALSGLHRQQLAACLAFAGILPCLAAWTQAQALNLQSISRVSGRSAILEDDGNMAYLYLSAPGMPRCERWLCIRGMRRCRRSIGRQ